MQEIELSDNFTEQDPPSCTARASTAGRHEISLVQLIIEISNMRSEIKPSEPWPTIIQDMIFTNINRIQTYLQYK
jgi:hypothetical protein